MSAPTMKKLFELRSSEAIKPGWSIAVIRYTSERCRPMVVRGWAPGFVDEDDVWIGAQRVALKDGEVVQHPGRPAEWPAWERVPVLEAGDGFRVEVSNGGDRARVFVAEVWGVSVAARRAFR